MSVGVILTILFVLLKVFHLIGWSWWIVFCPLMAEVVIDLLFVFGFFAALIKLLKD